MFWKIWEIFKNIFFCIVPQVAASVSSEGKMGQLRNKNIFGI